MLEGVKNKIIKLIPIFVFLSLSAVVLVVWFKIYSYTVEKEKNNFKTEAQEFVNVINKKIEAYTDVMYGVRGLFLASQSVERTEWRDYIRGTQFFNRNSGILSMAYVEKVANSDLDKFFHEVSIDTSTNKIGYPDIKLFPASQKNEYFLGKYAEPEEGYTKVFGFDFSSEPQRNTALLAARDLDKPRVTGIIRLISNNQPGLFIVLPIYKNQFPNIKIEDRNKNLQGFILSGIQVNSFFNGVMEEIKVYLKNDQNKHYVEIYDVDDHGKEELMFVNNTKLFNYKNNYFNTLDISFGGRTWRVFVYDENTLVLDNAEKSALIGGLILGLALVLMFSIFIHLLVRRRDDAVVLAQEITKDLKKKEEKLLSRSVEMEKLNQDLNIQQRAILNILEDVEFEKSKMEVLTNDLEKFKLAVENASDQIVITDPEGIVVYANAVVEKITGYKPEEALGKKAGSLWKTPMSVEYYKKLWSKIKVEKKPFVGEIQNRRKSGELYIANISISPVVKNTGEILFYVAIEHDITKEKQIDQAKTEFVSLASHQLRTPLSTINWYAEMLLDGDAGKINDEQRKYLDEIYKGNQRMVELVNSLLNVSRIELGTFAVDPENSDIRELPESVVDELKLLIEKKNIKIVKNYASDLEKIMLDPKLIRIVFQNLLTNSIKYTPENGTVSVTIEKKKNELLVSVSDNGYGIPNKDKDMIFTKMFRADNVKTKDTSGTGLGLYIIKSIIEQAVGGKIWFESEENKGTTFYFTIPLSGMKKKEGSKALT